MTEGDPLVGTYCGNNSPPEIVSTSNVLYVLFYTDGSVTDAGFNASYTQQDGLYDTDSNACFSFLNLVSMHG